MYHVMCSSSSFSINFDIAPPRARTECIARIDALATLREARSLGVSRVVMARMLANVAIDSVIGAVPLVGDIFDVAWRANRRNIALLQKHLAHEPRRF
jgi:uncharacterized protein DUF4112